MHLIFLLYALFASVFTLAKKGLEFSQPLFFIGSRMLVAGCLMLIWQHLIQRKPLHLSWKGVFAILQLAFFNIYLTNALEFWGLSHMTSSKTCFLYSLSPFLSALFSYWMFSERMSRSKWVGLGIGFLGIIPFLLDQSSEEVLSGSFFFLSLAEIAVLGATICSVYGCLCLRKLVKEHDLSPFTANGLSMVIGGAFALMHSGVRESWTPLPVTDLVAFLPYALALIVISNLICYNLYGWLLKRFTATFVSFCGFTTPFFAALFGWFFLSETIPYTFFLSSAILFSGLVVFYREELKPGLYEKPLVECE